MKALRSMKGYWGDWVVSFAPLILFVAVLVCAAVVMRHGGGCK
jgi:hypothetical protein